MNWVDVPVWQLEPFERQRIVIVDQAESKEPAAESGADERDNGFLVRVKDKVQHGVKSATGAVAGSLNQIRHRGSEDLHVCLVRPRDVRDVTFQPGHPMPNVVYIEHPVSPLYYLPAAQFHPAVFEHKFGELARLVMALGADDVRVEHEIGWGHGRGFDFSIFGAHVGLGTKDDSKNKILFRAKLNPTQRPSLPEHLHWYQHEPQWQTVAEGRLKSGLDNFSLRMEYTNSYGVDGGFRTKAKRAGFGLGGEYQDYERTIWRVTGTFADAPRRGGLFHR